MEEVKCYLDISISGQSIGRIVLKLFTDKCPKTCENFRCLCTGERGIGKSGKPLHYKGTPLHRIVKNFMIQGGDITDKNGKGGDSIYDGSFADENLRLAHDEPYLLSMANRGPDTNKSQFFITTNEAPHLDGKHVVFGRVISGLDTILKIERQEVDSRSRPLKKVLIEDCGQLILDEIPVQVTDKIQKQDDLKRRSLSRSPRNDKSLKRRRSRSISSRSSSCSSSSCSSSSSSPHSRRRHRRCDSSSSGSESDSSSSSGSSSGSSSSSVSGKDHTRCISSSGSSSSSSSNASSSSRSTSSSSSSSGSPSKTTRNSKAHRRSKASSQNQSVPSEVKKEAKKSDDESEEDTYVNPHYKCSVKREEIPEVPINKFLMRGPPKSKKEIPMDEEPDEIIKAPFEVDLSKFEDLPEDNSTTTNSAALKSQVKPTEHVVSRSGRVMKGRGTFRFRTPSPTHSNTDRRPSYSSRSRRYVRHDSYPTRYSTSRSRSRTPPRKHSRHKSNYRSRDSQRRTEAPLDD